MTDYTRTPAARAEAIRRRAVRANRYGHAGSLPRALVLPATGADLVATGLRATVAPAPPA